jgi:flavin reductase (DIM6/NTAB) family NADH-FMN oxidoreductase RutF
MSDPNVSDPAANGYPPAVAHADGEALRRVMRRVPSPVVVVTVGDTAAGPARGITIGSFTSVALEPPLVSFNVAHDAATHDLLPEGGRFVVHVLGEHQAHLGTHFAMPGRTGAEQLASVPHTRPDDDGPPLLDDVTARLHCTVHATVPAGDHTLVLGRLVAVDDLPDRGAVLYYRRAYRRVGDELA